MLMQDLGKHKRYQSWHFHHPSLHFLIPHLTACNHFVCHKQIFVSQNTALMKIDYIWSKDCSLHMVIFCSSSTVSNMFFSLLSLELVEKMFGKTCFLQKN